MSKRRSIPTVYNDIQMRSRLEAAWAAFFDELNLSWEYEPEDFDGWIPDFVIFPAGYDSYPRYVEVKPIYNLQQKEAKEAMRDIENTMQRSLLVGNQPRWDLGTGIGWDEFRDVIRLVLHRNPECPLQLHLLLDRHIK